MGMLLVCAVVLGGWAYQRQSKIERGQEAFRRLGCVQCHLSGGAPNLNGVTKRYDQSTLTRFIQNPETIYLERGKRPINSRFYPMPNAHASAADADAIVAYLSNMAE